MVAARTPLAGQRPQRDRRVPHRRLARLQADRVRLLRSSARRSVLVAVLHLRSCRRHSPGIAARSMLQIIGGKIAPRPSLSAKRSIIHCFGRGQGALREAAASRAARTNLSSAIDRAEEAVPTQQARAARSGPGNAAAASPRAASRNNSRMPSSRLDLRHRPAGRHDRQRHDDRPRPGADRVEIHREPRGNSSISGGTAGHCS